MYKNLNFAHENSTLCFLYNNKQNSFLNTALKFEMLLYFEQFQYEICDNN